MLSGLGSAGPTQEELLAIQEKVYYIGLALAAGTLLLAPGFWKLGALPIAYFSINYAYSGGM